MMAILVLAEVEDLHDVGVIQERADARLFHEHLDDFGEADHLGFDTLDRDRAGKAAGAMRDGAPHHRHATPPELLDELVLSGQHSPGAIGHSTAASARGLFGVKRWRVRASSMTCLPKRASAAVTLG
jgi:hypothetical protein